METISEHHVNALCSTGNRKSIQTRGGSRRTISSKGAMADRRRQEEDYVIAFKSGNKLVAEQLLPRIPQPAAITTTFEFSSRYRMLALVSLLHLAAYWGWRNVVTALVSVYKCAANCKDEEGHVPLHYAAYNGHLEVVKYFVIELVCNPMDRNKYGYTPLHYACENGHLNIAQYLIREEHCNPSCKNNNGWTPLHYACRYGNLSIAQYLIREEHCNPSCKSKYDETPLHYACCHGNLNIAQYLIREEHCNPSCKNKYGATPLHIACRHGNLNIAQYLIREEHRNPSCENKYGETPLHYACRYGHLNIAQYLIREEHCNPSCENNIGETPLHWACRYGNLNIAQYLIREEHCNPSCEDMYGETPLHYACRYGHLNIAQYLIREEHCNPSCENNIGETPLHWACRYGNLNIAQYLIREEHCNPSCENNIGKTPLHYACRYGHLNIAQYLIREEHCNPSCENNDGWTPLHIACLHNHAHIVQYLLSTGRVNPLAENKDDNTALYYASGNYDIIKLFQPFEECRSAFPVHTFTKLILIGDSGAGKTTITELIIRLASSTARTAVECVADVQRLTAGIVPHRIQSEQLGNFVVYDFAGQQEYYSSHAAVLEQVMRRSAAMFLCVVDLSESKEKICESLHYWLSFIDNACSTAEGRSHVVIVGSHADQVTSSAKEKSSLLQTIIATRRVRRQEYVGCIAMDCRRANTDASRRLIAILTNSQKAIAASQPVIHYYSHVVYAFLRTKLNVVGCTLHDLVSAVAKENDSSLPNDQSVLIDILTILSDRALILFIHHLHSSWVVVKTEALLNEINGTLFAPRQFKEHRDILASNTGIVSTSSLLSAFPHHNTDMLVGFLQSLNFCQPVEPSVLENTNLQTTPSHSTADLLFFPGLVQSERPDSLVQQEALKFGWCLGCVDPEQYFSSRFLHILLLSVAYRFSQSVRRKVTSSPHGLQRRCIVWKNGISWTDSDNITTLIELLDNNRRVLVAMSCSKDRPMKYAKLRSSLINLVHCLHQEHCPSLEVYECLISPSLVQQYPFNDLPDTELFDIQDVAVSILCRKLFIRSQSECCIGRLPTQSLPLEPYHLLSPSSVCELFDHSNADQPVSTALLHEITKHFNQLKMKPQVYKELREHLDRLSLFAGRNPLVSSVAVL